MIKKRQEIKETRGIDTMNKNIEPIKLEISKEYKELQERLNIDLANKKLFTLKKI